MHRSGFQLRINKKKDFFSFFLVGACGGLERVVVSGEKNKSGVSSSHRRRRRSNSFLLVLFRGGGRQEGASDLRSRGGASWDW